MTNHHFVLDRFTIQSVQKTKAQAPRRARITKKSTNLMLDIICWLFVQALAANWGRDVKSFTETECIENTPVGASAQGPNSRTLD